MRVALVDDDERIHSAIGQIFKARAPSWTLESFTGPTHALKAIPRNFPDAVLMDISMPEIDGIECTRKLKSLSPRLPIVIFTARDDPHRIASALGVGADGYVIKPASPEAIIHALASASPDLILLCQRSRELLLACLVRIISTPKPLTPRETEIMGCLLKNLTNKQIAEQLGITPGTARIHVENVLAKTRSHSRAQACRPSLHQDDSWPNACHDSQS